MPLILLLLKELLLLPQRYVFSSKSQHKRVIEALKNVVVATTKVRIFKQITTFLILFSYVKCCCCYHKGTYFQANHNSYIRSGIIDSVVVATTKVRIFKQITTMAMTLYPSPLLLLLPQRYVFSSKSQHERKYGADIASCCCYHKGTYFQANHNS